MKVGPEVQGFNLCSNRTFMELKLAKDYYNQTRQQVLIAPLWN